MPTYHVLSRRRLLAQAALIILLPLSAQAQKRALGAEEFSPGGPCDNAAWKLVFHDEFNGAALDRSKWITYFPFSEDGSENCADCRYMSGTNNIFTESQVSVNEGRLLLGVASKPTTWYHHTKDHEAGLVRSIGSAEFTYGRFEMRAKIPYGQGLWPAFWTFGGETEIDVLEMCGERTKYLKMALHRWGPQKHSGGGNHKGPDMAQNFHVYAVEWEPDEIRFYLDDELVLTQGRFVDARGRPLPGCDRAAGTHPTAPYYPRGTDATNILINLAVSNPKGFCKGPKRPVAWAPGTALEVDHVRVYQREPQTGLADLCAAPRKLAADGGEGVLRVGQERRYAVTGPHGDLHWSTGEGVAIVSRDASGITVRNIGTVHGPTWVRAESRDDPCPRGPLMLEAGLELGR